MGADIDLLMARREAERDMRDKCKVTRTSKGTEFNEVTGEYPTVVATIYEGKSRLKSPRVAAKQADAGSQLLIATFTEIQLPVHSDDLFVGDVVEMIACPDRPNQVGRKFTVMGPFDGTQTTSLRYRVEVFDGR